MPQDSLVEGADEVRSPSLTWLDVIEDVMDAAMEGEAEYELQFEEFEVEVPDRMGDDAHHYRWGLDGDVRIRIEGAHGPLADWLKWWHTRLA